MELSNEELSLLFWLAKQPAPVTREQLMPAPFFDSRRCESLRQRGYLWCPEPGYLDTAARTYALTDKGRAAVSAEEEFEKRNKMIADDKAARESNDKVNRRFAIIGFLISIIAAALSPLLAHLLARL